MIYLFILFLALEWSSSFLLVYFFRFKEEYKEYHEQLFERANVPRPEDWKLSRLKNHKRYKIFLWLTPMTVILVLGYGYFTQNDVIDSSILIALTFIVPLVIALFGAIIGKNVCQKAVRKECEKFGISCITIWQPLCKKSSSNTWRFLLFVCVYN